MTIFPGDIEKAIRKLEESGVGVTSDSHVIYAGENTEFWDGVYPLQIVITKSMPKNTAAVVSRKDAK